MPLGSSMMFVHFNKSTAVLIFYPFGQCKVQLPSVNSVPFVLESMQDIFGTPFCMRGLHSSVKLQARGHDHPYNRCQRLT